MPARNFTFCTMIPGIKKRCYILFIAYSIRNKIGAELSVRYKSGCFKFSFLQSDPGAAMKTKFTCGIIWTKYRRLSFYSKYINTFSECKTLPLDQALSHIHCKISQCQCLY